MYEVFAVINFCLSIMVSATVLTLLYYAYKHDNKLAQKIAYYYDGSNEIVSTDIFECSLVAIIVTITTSFLSFVLWVFVFLFFVLCCCYKPIKSLLDKLNSLLESNNNEN